MAVIAAQMLVVFARAAVQRVASAGSWLGKAAAGRVPAHGARAAVVIALAGASATTVKGLLTWVS